MQGLMMQGSLSILSIIQHAVEQHPDQEIVSITHDHARFRYTYADAYARMQKLANGLSALGLTQSDRVGTLAWNDHRHFELYYAISCSGYVCHTINPRLFEKQIEFIIGHAEDTCLFLDPQFLSIVENLQNKLGSVKHYIILSDLDNMPETTLKNAICYETLINQNNADFDWSEIDENEASSLCYTSGTTGDPKGVLYSHRSSVLHACAVGMPDAMSLSAADVVLPVVPMFHANAWGLNYVVPMVGAKYVLPGPFAGNSAVLTDLMNSEDVTISAGVPTIWLGLLQYLEKEKLTLNSLVRTVVGGAACSISLMDEFREKHGVETIHAWGMTETSPLGSIFAPKQGFSELGEAEKQVLRAKQGRTMFGVQMKIIDDDGHSLPWDGEAFGSLLVRGGWVASGYFNSDDSDDFKDGWFETGDVSTIDADGYMQIIDRTKDVIKSGGEWISSIELENTIMAHKAVAEAAVIGVPHPKWSERPLLVVVKNAQHDVSKEELLAFFKGKVADWWIPTEVRFIDQLPHTATGKISKLELRKIMLGV